MLREWRLGDNYRECAPLAFTDDGDAEGEARHANFAGGWAVAFDMPDIRSAYGIAGPGLIPADRADVVTQETRLREQWPYFIRLENLPAPAFAGYGIEGAEPYPDDAPDGRGRQSLAYVRVAGQSCTYNVWSKLGRDHLERLLKGLVLIETR